MRRPVWRAPSSSRAQMETSSSAARCTWSARCSRWRSSLRAGVRVSRMQAGEQAFYRGSDRIVGGVCSGLAAGFHIDPLWVRIAFVLLAFLQGIVLFIYIVLLLVMPQEGEGGSGARSGFEFVVCDRSRLRYWREAA